MSDGANKTGNHLPVIYTWQLYKLRSSYPLVSYPKPSTRISSLSLQMNFLFDVVLKFLHTLYCFVFDLLQPFRLDFFDAF